MHRSLLSLRQRARDLRVEAGRIKRAQLANTESMKETVHETFLKIKVRNFLRTGSSNVTHGKYQNVVYETFIEIKV